MQLSFDAGSFTEIQINFSILKSMKYIEVYENSNYWKNFLIIVNYF